MENKVNEKTENWGKWTPFFLFAIVTIIYSFRFFEPGTKIFGHDTYLLQGGNDFNQDSYNRGEIPFWIPYSFSGMPNLAALSTEAVYPTFIIWHLLKVPPHLIYLFEYMISLCAAGFFTYLFAKTLGLAEISSFVTGVFFMFCGNLSTIINPGHINNMEAISVIPLVFYFLEKGFQNKKYFYFVLVGCVFGWQSLAVGYQIMVYTIVTAGLYLLFKIVFLKEPPKYLFYFISGIMIIPLISAVQFLPSFFYLKHSYRAEPTYKYFTSWSFHPAEVITYLIPRFFGLMEETYWGHNPFWLNTYYLGILPILLSFVAVFFLLKNDKKVLGFTILTTLALVLSFGGNTPLYRILYYMPVISKFRTSARWTIFFDFFLIILAGIGVNFIFEFVNKKHKPGDFRKFNIFKISLVILSISFLVSWLVFLLNSSKIANAMQSWELIRNRFAYEHGPYITGILYKMISGDMLKLALLFTVSAILIILGFYSKLNKYVFLGGLLFIYFIDIIPVINLCVRKVPVAEQNIQREEIVDFLKNDKSLYRVLPLGELFDKNWFASEKIQSVNGYGVPLKDYYEARGKGLFNNISFLSLLNVKYVITGALINHAAFQLVSSKNINIYQNLANLPRSFLYNKVEVIKNKEEIFNKINQNNFNCIERLIINEDFNEKLDDLTFKGNEAKIINFSPNRINIEVEAPGDCMLFLSEIYYPEWKAKVDGNEAKIYNAFGVFRAVYLPKGYHKIEFWYSAKIFYIGLFITIITAAGVLIMILSNNRLNKGQR
ncbi:MAG: YfhO family protein [bacterium]